MIDPTNITDHSRLIFWGVSLFSIGLMFTALWVAGRMICELLAEASDADAEAEALPLPNSGRLAAGGSLVHFNREGRLL